MNSGTTQGLLLSRSVWADSISISTETRTEQEKLSQLCIIEVSQ